MTLIITDDYITLRYKNFQSENDHLEEDNIVTNNEEEQIREKYIHLTQYIETRNIVILTT